MNQRLINTIPFLMPVGPAIVLAMTIYRILSPHWIDWLAISVAIILASLFEISGYYIAHGFIIQVEAGNTERWFVNLVFLLIFVGCGVGIIAWGHQDIGSDLVAAILAAFPVLAAMVYITQGMRLGVDHVQTKLDYRDDEEWRLKLDIKRQRAEAQIASKYASKQRPNSVQFNGQLNGNNTILDTANAQRFRNMEERLDAVLAYLDDHPNASYRQIGVHVGRSKSTGENYAHQLVEAGKLKRNGQGWEVIHRNGSNQ